MNPLAGFDRIQVTDADVEAVLDCLNSGWLTMGPRIQAFEQAFAERLGTDAAIAVSSGIVSLHLAFQALGLGRGDEVLLAALGSGRAADAIRSTGAEPIACEVRSAAEPVLDPAALEQAFGPRTRAVLVTHPVGYAAPVDEIAALCESHGVVLVEDATDALGATLSDGRPAGTAGTLGCFDLSIGSQLPIGEGGMIVGTDEDAVAKVRSLRSHAMTSVTWDRHRGHADSYDVVDIGFNYRMDEPRAALGLSRLERYDAELARRRDLARAWRAAVEGLDGIAPAFDDAALERSANLAFPVLLDDSSRRALAAAALERAGVSSRPAAMEPVTVTPLAAQAGERLLLLPLGETVDEAQVEAGVAALRG